MNANPLNVLLKVKDHLFALLGQLVDYFFFSVHFGTHSFHSFHCLVILFTVSILLVNLLTFQANDWKFSQLVQKNLGTKIGFLFLIKQSKQLTN